MTTKKNIHMTGALGAILSSGSIGTVEQKLAYKKSSNTVRQLQILNNDLSESLLTTNISNHVQSELYPSESIININTSSIIRWEHKDRPENELGDISELAKTIQEIGQQVPCIVRPKKGSDNVYELIAGERRYHAVKSLGLPLKAIVRPLSDYQAGLVQAIENEQRTDLSDYARGMSYARMIENGILKQKDLTDILQISPQQVSRLLSFRNIPEKILTSLQDLRKISSRTSEEIVRLSKKGNEYIEAIQTLSEKISSGKIGGNRLAKDVTKVISLYTKHETKINKVLTGDGRHLFTWRLDNNQTPSIHFPKDIIKLIDDKKLSLDLLTNHLKDYLAFELANIKEDI